MKLQTPFLYLLAAPALFAAIDGTVINATTGKPQPSVSVALVQPGQGGMQTLGSATSDAQGKFSIDKTPPPGPALLQGTFKDVTYTLILQPGAPASGLEMSVFDTTTDPRSAKIAQHVFLFEPGESGVQVTEVFQIENETKATFSDPAKGSLQVYIPAEPKALGAVVEGTAGMSIRRPLQKTQQTGVYKLDYAIKPGGGRIDVSYSIPSAEKLTFKVLRWDVTTRIATPSGVTLTGAAVRELGMEPNSQAHLYEVLPKATSFEAILKGSGSLRTKGAPDDAPKEDDGSPKPEIINARIYTRLPWVLGLTAVILLLGGTMLYRKGTA